MARVALCAGSTSNTLAIALAINNRIDNVQKFLHIFVEWEEKTNVQRFCAEKIIKRLVRCFIRSRYIIHSCHCVKNPAATAPKGLHFRASVKMLMISEQVRSFMACVQFKNLLRVQYAFYKRSSFFPLALLCPLHCVFRFWSFLCRSTYGNIVICLRANVGSGTDLFVCCGENIPMFGIHGSDCDRVQSGASIFQLTLWANDTNANRKWKHRRFEEINVSGKLKR